MASSYSAACSVRYLRNWWTLAYLSVSVAYTYKFWAPPAENTIWAPCPGDVLWPVLKFLFFSGNGPLTLRAPVAGSAGRGVVTSLVGL